MTNRTRDLLPGVRAAGITSNIIDESAANCVKPKDNLNPGTPAHLKKFRNSYKNSHGHKILHYGVYDDQQPNENFIFGKKISGSDHVKDTFDGQKDEGIKQMINEIQEAKYQSHKQEPLGKKMERNYIFPAATQTDGFKFGLPVVNSEYTSKEVMFPQKPYFNDKKAQEQYLFSHKNYEAGQQKNRGYNWKINPKLHRFGKTEETILNQVMQCLQQDSMPDQFPKTKIVEKKQEDFRNFKDDQLGLPKNLAQDNSRNDPNIVFGARLGEPDEWNAGKCINGEGTLKEVKTDADLGTTTRFGFRNTTKSGDESRVFGVPTIRDDILKKGMKSIADPNNYGDEKPALALLFPEKYHFMGVNNEDFLSRRYKYEIKDLFEKVGFKYKIGKFEGIYLRALEIDNSIDQKCSAKSFLEAVKEMDHIQ